MVCRVGTQQASPLCGGYWQHLAQDEVGQQAQAHGLASQFVPAERAILCAGLFCPCPAIYKTCTTYVHTLQLRELRLISHDADAGIQQKGGCAERRE
jgi:hypothetical protein